MKNCYNCKHFHIRQEPLRGKEGLYDLGLAECTKHNLITDFMNHGKLRKLKCIKEDENGK